MKWILPRNVGPKPRAAAARNISSALSLLTFNQYDGNIVTSRCPLLSRIMPSISR